MPANIFQIQHSNGMGCLIWTALMYIFICKPKMSLVLSWLGLEMPKISGALTVVLFLNYFSITYSQGEMLRTEIGKLATYNSKRYKYEPHIKFQNTRSNLQFFCSFFSAKWDIYLRFFKTTWQKSSEAWASCWDNWSSWFIASSMHLLPALNPPRSLKIKNSMVLCFLGCSCHTEDLCVHSSTSWSSSSFFYSFFHNFFHRS